MKEYFIIYTLDIKYTEGIYTTLDNEFKTSFSK